MPMVFKNWLMVFKKWIGKPHQKKQLLSDYTYWRTPMKIGHDKIKSKVRRLTDDELKEMSREVDRERVALEDERRNENKSPLKSLEERQDFTLRQQLNLLAKGEIMVENSRRYSAKKEREKKETALKWLEI